MVQVVAKWINAQGGLNGHPVRIISADDGGDPAKAQAIAKDMVESQGAIAFMGNLMLFATNAVEEYLRPKGIPVIGGDGASERWWQSPVLFPVTTSLDLLSTSAAKQAALAGKKKIAVLYCVELEGCKSWGESVQPARAGVEVVYRAQVSLTQPDYTSECLQAQSRGAEAILLGVDSGSMSRIARSCAQQGYRPFYASAGLIPQVSLAKDPNFDGLVATIGTFPWPANDTEGAQAFQAAVRQYAPDLELSSVATVVWASGTLLKKVGAALPAAPTPRDFLTALAAVRQDDLGGVAAPQTFTAGQPAAKSPCYFVVQVAGGKFTAPHGSKQFCL
jgi:branched-chain amino acid transport system substrate-binding protein